MTVCGFMPAEIDNLTWWDVQALTSYWQDFPPAHEALKIGFGLERKPAPEPLPNVPRDSNDPSGIGGLIAQFPSGYVPADR